MPRSTLEQWRMFKAVIDNGGFQQAADVIYKSQSTIHHAVHKLEETLGVKLVEITGRKTTITPAGEILLRRINYLIADADRMENVAFNMQAGIESKLAIAIDEAFPKPLLYKVLDNVSAEYPLLRIDLMETILAGANELLGEGKVEISLSPFTLLNNLNEEICTVELMAVAGKEHPLHRLERELTVEDLKAHRQIVLRDSALHNKKDEGWLGSEQRWTVSHTATSMDLIINNLGFAWLPANSIQAHINSGALVPLRIARGATRFMPLYLNFIDADCLGPAARSFIGHLRFLTSDVSIEQ